MIRGLLPRRDKLYQQILNWFKPDSVLHVSRTLITGMASGSIVAFNIDFNRWHFEHQNRYWERSANDGQLQPQAVTCHYRRWCSNWRCGSRNDTMLVGEVLYPILRSSCLSKCTVYVSQKWQRREHRWRPVFHHKLFDLIVIWANNSLVKNSLFTRSPVCNRDTLHREPVTIFLWGLFSTGVRCISHSLVFFSTGPWERKATGTINK